MLFHESNLARFVLKIYWGWADKAVKLIEKERKSGHHSIRPKTVH